MLQVLLISTLEQLHYPIMENNFKYFSSFKVVIKFPSIATSIYALLFKNNYSYTLEGKILQDANRMDTIFDMTIARTLVLVKNSSLYDLIHLVCKNFIIFFFLFATFFTVLLFSLLSSSNVIPLANVIVLFLSSILPSVKIAT
jgi:hypothetical protein